MPTPLQAECRNRLLARMSTDDFGLIAPDLELREGPKGEMLSTPGGALDYVYFPESGIVSVVATSPEGHKAEAGLFGREGFGPVAALLGADRSVQEVMVQMTGQYHRLRLDALLRATEGSAALRTLLLKFVHVMSVQIAQTALANAVHQVDERLARWILMVHDRSESDEIALTHEFISVMLAVRRPSVTTSLHVLEGHLFIRSERGHITIRNRLALEQFARNSYGQPEAEYRRLIGPM